MSERLEISIPTLTILKIVGIILGILLLWAIRDILVLMFIVLILVTAMSPVVAGWSKRMARPLAIALLYGIIVAIITLALVLIIPPLIVQIRELALNLPSYVQQFLPAGSVRDVVALSQTTLANLSNQLANFGDSIFRTTSAFLAGIFTIFTIFVLTFYLLIEERQDERVLLSIIPDKERRERLLFVARKVGDKMGAWVRGQLLLMLTVGLLNLIGLLILGVPYALTLGIWSGLTEIIPYVGPIIGAIPAVILAFGESPLKGMLVILLFAVVQQLEAQVLVPKIMQRAVGLSPAVIILAILIGAKLMGLLGVILAVPLAAGGAVLLKEEWPNLRKIFGTQSTR
jgi:predicted PurR-regulated permease PerM